MPRRTVEWNDVAHAVLFDAIPIAIFSALVGWRFGVVLMGMSCWGLGWHQQQHHRERRHIHLPFRIVGSALMLLGLALLLRQ